MLINKAAVLWVVALWVACGIVAPSSLAQAGPVRRVLRLSSAPGTDPRDVIWERPDGVVATIFGDGLDMQLRDWFSGAGIYHVGCRGDSGWTAPVQLHGRETAGALSMDRNGYIMLTLQSDAQRGVRVIQRRTSDGRDVGAVDGWVLQNRSDGAVRVHADQSGVRGYFEVWDERSLMWNCPSCVDALDYPEISVQSHEERAISPLGLRQLRVLPGSAPRRRVVVEMQRETTIAVPLTISRVQRATALSTSR